MTAEYWMLHVSHFIVCCVSNAVPTKFAVPDPTSQLASSRRLIKHTVLESQVVSSKSEDTSATNTPPTSSTPGVCYSDHNYSSVSERNSDQTSAKRLKPSTLKRLGANA